MQPKRTGRVQKHVASGLSTFWTYARRDLLGSEPVQLMLWQRVNARKLQLARRLAKPAPKFAAG